MFNEVAPCRMSNDFIVILYSFFCLFFYIFLSLPPLSPLRPRLREFKRQEYTVSFHLFEGKGKKEKSETFSGHGVTYGGIIM